MNLLLLAPDELLPDGTARVQGRRARHVAEVLRAGPGDTLRAGVLGGKLGTARLLALEEDGAHLALTLTDPPPSRPGVDLLLAMPRPKALRRVLAAVASLGVDRLVLLNAARVEKSYFGSPVLGPEKSAAALRDGLEQARDTRPPEVHVFERFRPFVEDTLDGLLGPGVRLLLDPGPEPATPAIPRGARVALAIGPEGGWVPFERELLAVQGFAPVSLGPRTLRVEAVLPYALGWLSGKL
jgi:RsmE family RNA methyltransferase